MLALTAIGPAPQVQQAGRPVERGQRTQAEDRHSVYTVLRVADPQPQLLMMCYPYASSVGSGTNGVARAYRRLCTRSREHVGLDNFCAVV